MRKKKDSHRRRKKDRAHITVKAIRGAPVALSNNRSSRRAVCKLQIAAIRKDSKKPGTLRKLPKKRLSVARNTSDTFQGERAMVDSNIR